MLAQLGDIQFETLKTPSSWSESHEATYGEIPHVGGKPSIQKTGEALASIDLSIRFLVEFCDPSEEVEKLKQAKTTGEVLPFITGTGVMMGRFVIKSLGVQVEKMSAEGELIAVRVDISLTEYVYPPGSTQPNNGTALKSNNPIRQIPRTSRVTDARAISNDISKANLAVSKAKSIVADVKKGIKSFNRGIREIKRAADTAKQMYNEAQQKLQETKKILERASNLPTSLDEAIAYAENLGRIESILDISTLEMQTNQLARSADKVTSGAAPVASFNATLEGGN